MLSYLEIICICIAAVLSMVSQLPFMEESSLGMFFRASWALPLMPLLFSKLRYFTTKYTFVYFLFIVNFSLFCYFCEYLTDDKYLGVDLVNICISFVIFVISHVLYNDVKRKEVLLTVFSIVLLISGSIVGYVVNEIADLTAGLDTVQYAYQNKNSMGQILLCCAVIPFFLYKPSSRLMIVVKYSLIVYILFVVFMLKSRATLLGLFYITGYYVVTSKEKKIRYACVALFFLIIIALVSFPNIYDLFVNQILLANRDASDLDDASSGRVDYYPFYINGFFESPLIGNGTKYFDCMPIIVLYQYGLLGGFIFFSFIIYFWAQLYKKRKRSDLSILAYLLFMAYILNSLFEAQPPFGPGIKCSFLWVIVGFAFASNNKRPIRNKSVLKSLLTKQ